LVLFFSFRGIRQIRVIRDSNAWAWLSESQIKRISGFRGSLFVFLFFMLEAHLQRHAGQSEASSLSFPFNPGL